MEGRNNASFRLLTKVPDSSLARILQKLDAITFSRLYKTCKFVQNCADGNSRLLHIPIDQIMRTSNFEDKTSFWLIKEKIPNRRKSRIVTLKKSNIFTSIKKLFKKYFIHFFRFKEIVLCFNEGRVSLNVHSQKRAIDLANKFAFACYEANITCFRLRTYYPSFLNSPIRVFRPTSLIITGGLTAGAPVIMNTMELVAFYNVTLPEARYLIRHVLPHQKRFKICGFDPFDEATFEQIIVIVKKLADADVAEAEFMLEMKTTPNADFPKVIDYLESGFDYVFLERGVLDFSTTFGLLFLSLPSKGFVFFTGFHDKVACDVILVHKVVRNWDEFINFFCRVYRKIVRVAAREAELRVNPELLTVKNRYFL